MKTAAILLIALFSSVAQAEDYATSQGQCGTYLFAVGKPTAVIKAFLDRHPATPKSQAIAGEFGAELASSFQSGRKSHTQLMLIQARNSCMRLGVNP